jgi:hypothetical protein
MKRCSLGRHTIGLFVASGLLVLACGVVSYGQGAPRDNDPHATGYIPPTAEQERQVLETRPRIVKVWPNRLAWVRVNEERKQKGLDPLPERGFVPKGAEKDFVVGHGPVVSHVPTGFVGLAGTASSVDNSLLDAFPEIRTQGSIGSCTNFAVTYYQLTYTVGRLYGWNNKNVNNDTKFSPKWTYNMINGGEDKGSWPGDAYAVLEGHGAARWSLFPYQTSSADPRNYREWCRDGETWRDAIGYRIEPFAFLAPPASSDGFDTWLTDIKTMLADVEVLTFATYISGWQYATIQDDKSTADDNAFVRRPVAYWVNNSAPANHMMTIVGYNDSLWTDVNKNRKVDPGEKGALRIANSWGPNWQDSGFCWLAYDALRSESGVAGGPSSGRQPAIAGKVFSIELKYDPYADPPQVPVLLGKFRLSHPKRHQLRITLGVYNDGGEDEALISPWIPGALQSQGGPYAFDGSTVACDGTFVFDFTDVLRNASTSVPYALQIEDLAAGDPATFLGYKLTDTTGRVSGGLLLSPATFDNDTVTVGLAYPSALESAPVAVVSASSTSGRVPLTVKFDGAGSSGNIYSYVWDFGDGSAPRTVQAPETTTTYTYNTAGTYTATLTVLAASWTEASSQLVVTATGKKR